MLYKSRIKLIDDICIEDALEIYKSNVEYFRLCGTEKIDINTLKKDLEALPEGVKSEQKHFYVYYDEKAPIGIVDMIAKFPDDDAVYIGLLLVSSSRHRKGFGTQMYESIEREVKDFGFERIRLGVIETNIKGMVFWEQLGFTKVKTVYSTINKEIRTLVNVMEKIL